MKNSKFSEHQTIKALKETKPLWTESPNDCHHSDFGDVQDNHPPFCL